jgi:hypothetical protein
MGFRNWFDSLHPLAASAFCIALRSAGSVRKLLGGWFQGRGIDRFEFAKKVSMADER